MSKQSLARVVFVPIGIYLAGLLALAAFVLHPPALGWIGLAVAAFLALLAGAAVVAFLPRVGANAVRLHPRAGAVYRLLVVADVDAEPDELCSAVGLRAIGRPAEVHVVTPVIATPLHFLADDEEGDRHDAGRRLEATLSSLTDIGVRAVGVVGTDDPLQAAGDALAGFDADEILFVGPVRSSRAWLDQNFESRARDLFGIPVATVFGAKRSPTAVLQRRSRTGSS